MTETIIGFIDVFAVINMLWHGLTLVMEIHNAVRINSWPMAGSFFTTFLFFVVALSWVVARIIT